MLTPKAGLRDLIRRAQGGSLDRGSADNLIQAPHIKRRLQRALNLKEMAPVPSLSSEVLPVIIVDDLTSEKVDLDPDFYISAEFTAGAGNFSQIEFINPAGSSHFVRITSMDVQAVAAGACRWQKRLSTLGTGIVNASFTNRGSGVTDSAGSVSFPFLIQKVDNALQFGFGNSHPFRANSTGAPFFDIDLDVEVHEGEVFAVQLALANTTIEVLLACTVYPNPA